MTSYKYGIIHNLKNNKGKKSLEKLFDYLIKENIPFCFNKDYYSGKKGFDILKPDEIIDKSNIILVLGGDGSMLEAVRMIEKRDKPVIGINLGKLGFLADIDLSEMEDKIKLIEVGDYEIEERCRLEAIYGKQKLTALNDIVIDKGFSSRVIKIDVEINDIYFTTYTADGIILATATGSTAYNLSASGPIMQPGVKGIILTPISPHALAQRPMIIPETSVVKITVETPDGGMMLSGDGQDNLKMSSKAEIIIKQADFKSKFIKFKGRDYYRILREKLGWGGFKKRYHQN